MAGSKVWFETREPGKAPRLIGPFPASGLRGELAALLRARPIAFVTVLSIDEFGVPSIDDGPGLLERLDMRCHSTAFKQRQSAKAAFGRWGAGK